METAAQTSETRGTLSGFITECHLVEADHEFPGILRFYLACETPPATFLDLLVRFLSN